MTALALVASTAQQAAEHENTLPMPAWAFGALALLGFVVLLGITWSFKSIGVHHGEGH